MKHLIETTNSSSLGFAEYDRLILDSTKNEIVYRGGVKYELIPDSYIYNETDNKYYQKLVAYSEPIETNATVDLNSEWVEDSEDSNYKYFKSNSNVGLGNSFSQCKVTWSNLTSITFKYMSSSEMGFDYLCVGKLDGEKFTAKPCDGYANVYLSTNDKTSGTYYEFTIECDKGEHHIWFCYRKDGSGNKGEDRGFIGVPKSVVPILDVKQGSELPMERNYGGISAEGGKIYDINFNKVTVPNGNIVGDYKNVEKTEKAINTEYVDLGLPNGTLWAKCNIGATSETEGGVFFQWGDISGVSGSLVGKYSDKVFDWAHYKYYNGSYNTMTKYCTDSSYGKVDGKTTLDLEDDAARAIMGGVWRMPTATEFQELYDSTDHVWITNYNGSGVNGMKFTSKTNGNSIFFPASGYADGSGVNNRGSNGSYWSSSLRPSYSNYGLGLNFNSGDIYPQGSNGRYLGFCVRSVLENLS